MDSGDTVHSELVGYLLASVVDETNLQKFSDTLSSLHPDTVGVALRRIDTLTRTEDVIGISGFDEGSIRSFIEYYSSRNVYQQALAQIPLNRPAYALSHLDRRAIEKTEFYTDWKRPQGLGPGGLAVNVARSGRYVLCASIEMSDRVEEEAGGDFERLLGRLTPHLATLAVLNGKAWARGVNAAVDTMQTGVLVISHFGRVLHMNDAAERLLSATSVSVDAKGMVRGGTTQAHGIAEAAIDDVLAGRTPSRTVRLQDLGYLGHIHLTVSRLPEGRGGRRSGRSHLRTSRPPSSTSRRTTNGRG